MKKLYFKTIFNTLLTFVISTFFSFAILNYFVYRTNALTLAITLSLLISIISFRLMLTKGKKQISESRHSEHVLSVMTELCFYSVEKVKNLFFKAYANLGLSPEKKTQGIFLPASSQMVFCSFDFDGLTKSDIVKAYNRLTKNQTALILSYSYSNEVKNFSSRFNGQIELLDQNQIYDILEKGNCVPSVTTTVNTMYSVKKVRISDFLDKKKAKKFLALGLLVLAFSFFVPLKAYYLISGSLLVILSVGVILFTPSPSN